MRTWLLALAATSFLLVYAVAARIFSLPVAAPGLGTGPLAGARDLGGSSTHRAADSRTNRRTAPLALASAMSNARAPIQLPELSDLDRQILRYSPARDPVRLKARLNSEFGRWTREAVLTCVGKVSMDPSRLRVRFSVTASTGSAQITQLRGISVDSGAPLGDVVVGCLEDSLRRHVGQSILAAPERFPLFEGEVILHFGLGGGACSTVRNGGR